VGLSTSAFLQLGMLVLGWVANWSLYRADRAA
jgi:hypothetical protein